MTWKTSSTFDLRVSYGNIPVNKLSSTVSQSNVAYCEDCILDYCTAEDSEYNICKLPQKSPNDDDIYYNDVYQKEVTVIFGKPEYLPYNTWFYYDDTEVCLKSHQSK